MIKRPLLWILGTYVTGLYLSWFQLSSRFVIAGMLSIILMIYLYMYRGNNRKIHQRDTFLWCLPFLLFFGYLSTDAQLQKSELYACFDREIDCQLSGQIFMIVEKQWGRALYVRNNEVLLPADVKQQSFQPMLCENVIIYISDEQSYQVGNQITVLGTLQKFSAATNPGQFNEELYYQIENIDFKMEAELVTITDPRSSTYHTILERIKRKLIAVYSSILEEKEAGTLIAMLLGEKYLLKDEIKQLYQMNGISHVLAISGLHVSLIGMFIFQLLRLFRLSIKYATFFTIFFIYSYGVLTNFSVSTNRAVVMMVILLISTLLGKTYDMLSAMALSALIILLQNPLQIFSAGFLLSFSAILGIAVVYPALKNQFKNNNTILNSLLISTSAQLTTMPFVLYFFYQVPTYGIITNLIILPFVTILTLTSILAGIAGVIYLPLGIFLIGASNYILQFYEFICDLGSKIPGNLITIGKPTDLQLFLYLMLLIAFCWIAGKYQKKVLLLLPIVASILLFIWKPVKGLEVTFLDVGQGDGIFMESETGTTYFIDGGSSDVSKVGKYRISPYLLSKGRSRLDYAIITHPDMDHISGILELMENGSIRIAHLVLPAVKEKSEAYLQLEEIAQVKGIKLQYLSAGDRIIDGSLQIFCLHPGRSYNPSSTNAYSTVLSISYGDYDMLLTGDLLEDGEKIILDYLRDDNSWSEQKIRPALEYEVLNKRVMKLIQLWFLCSAMKIALY